MKQYNFEGRKLTLKVKKSPLIGRIFLFFLASVFLLMPFSWIGFVLFTDQTWSFGHFFGLFFTCLIGVYALRLSLWNTYGKETFDFKDQTICYEVDYKWFKDAKKKLEFDDLNFEINPIGNLEDRKGVLVLKSSNGDIEDNEIRSVVKMPIEEIEEVIGLVEGFGS